MPKPTEEELPELATNDEWRETMVSTRKARGLTQEQLGDRVGASQVMISKLESGEAGASKLVLPICRELQIGIPSHFADADQRAWMELYAQLQKHPEQYDAAVRFLRSMLDRPTEH